MSKRAKRRRREIKKTLASGDGIFWDFKSDGIYLKSKEEVARALGVKALGRAVDIPFGLFLSLGAKLKRHILQLVAGGKTQEEVLQEISKH